MIFFSMRFLLQLFASQFILSLGKLNSRTLCDH